MLWDFGGLTFGTTMRYLGMAAVLGFCARVWHLDAAHLLAGTFSFSLYTMGETQMGVYKFSSWTLPMASIIVFSSLWGIALHEWRGSSRRTKAFLALSLFELVSFTVIVGYGNYLATR